MALVGRMLLNIAAALFLIFAIWQVVGLLPVLTWLKAPDQVTTGMWITLITKALIFCICLLAFKGLRALARKLLPKPVPPTPPVSGSV